MLMHSELVGLLQSQSTATYKLHFLKEKIKLLEVLVISCMRLDDFEDARF